AFGARFGARTGGGSGGGGGGGGATAGVATLGAPASRRISANSSCKPARVRSSRSSRSLTCSSNEVLLRMGRTVFSLPVYARRRATSRLATVPVGERGAFAVYRRVKPRRGARGRTRGG